MKEEYYRVWRNRDHEIVVEEVKKSEEHLYGKDSFVDPECYETYEQANIARLHYLLTHSGCRDNMHIISDKDLQTLLMLLEEKLKAFHS